MWLDTPLLAAGQFIAGQNLVHPASGQPFLIPLPLDRLHAIFPDERTHQGPH
jgi:hypothetical protein